jgi:uncharacterized Zn-finger protein
MAAPYFQTKTCCEAVYQGSIELLCSQPSAVYTFPLVLLDIFNARAIRLSLNED